jgi:hypothetical protein
LGDIFCCTSTPKVPVVVISPSSIPLISAKATLFPLTLIVEKSLLFPSRAISPVVDANEVSPIAVIIEVDVCEISPIASTPKVPVVVISPSSIPLISAKCYIISTYIDS